MQNENFKEISQKILAAIKASNKVLLSFHPHPDADSIGSNLAMYEVLEAMGKKPTLIRGDTDQNRELTRYPNSQVISDTDVSLLDLSKFDLFLVMDASSPDQFSKLRDITKASPNTPLVLIDHHPYTKFTDGTLLVDTEAVATCELIYRLLSDWKYELTESIATNLMYGIYQDTKGFTNLNSTARGLQAYANIVEKVPDFAQKIFEFENRMSSRDIAYLTLALTNTNTFLDGKVAISTLSYKTLVDNGFDKDSASKTRTSELLRRCSEWSITAALVEDEPGSTGMSIRSRSPDTDVSLVAQELGGGGHKVASGASVKASAADATKVLVEAIKKHCPTLL